MKILIVKLSAFGDVIHAQPALADLLARHEVSEVHWLVDSRYAFVTELFPPEVVVHQVTLKGKGRWQRAITMIKQLRKQHFDLILDLQGLVKSGVIARSIGATVYGFPKSFSPEWPNHYLVQSTDFHASERHVVQKYRHIAALPFADSDRPKPYLAPHFYHTEHHQELGKQCLNNIGIHEAFSIVHLGGGWETKKMSYDFWVELIQALHERHSPILLTWGNADEQALAASLLHHPQVFTHSERLDIHTLAGVLQQAKVIIGGDTGLSHLAAALDRPTITLWGPSASWNSAPLGEQHRHVESNPPCGPCFKRRCENFICLPSLRPEDVIHAWESLSL